MSKSNDLANDYKNFQKAYGNMSYRQQIIYLKNKTHKEKEWTIDRDMKTQSDDENDEQIDFHQVYLDQKEKFRKSIQKPLLNERNKFIKMSNKEFTLIKKNIYLDRKKYPFTDDEAFICSCEKPAAKRNELTHPDLSFACGKACINKMVSWECVESLCPSGSLCRNRRFQLHQYSEVYPVPTKDRGWGLFAGEPLPKGTFVMQYIGEIYSIDSDVGVQKIKQYRNKTCTYLMSISKNEVIDPTFKGNLARFINHSCEPNCETQKWHVLGEVCVGIFTLKDVNEGEELTFNYGFDIMKTTFQKCLCKAKNCKGYLGVAQNEVSSSSNTQIIFCAKCGKNWRNNDPILVCEKCKKIFHKVCLKPKQIKLVDDMYFFCKICIGKNEKKIIKDKSKQRKEVIDDIDNNLEIKNVIQSLKEVKVENNDNIKPPLIKSIVETIDIPILITENENINREIELVEINNLLINSNKEKEEEISIKSEEKQMITKLNISKFTNINNDDLKDESNEKIDEVFEVDETQLNIILKNLRSISRFGARFFWEKNRMAVDQKIELKISGTKMQNDNVIQAIKKIFEENRLNCENISLEMSVPKIFLRKIIGHQSRNLNSYKSKYNVEIDYDINLITDDIFPINETTILKIVGNDKNVRIVEKRIHHFLFNLKVMTIFMLNNDYLQLKNSICQLKNLADPADLRLRKKEAKIEKEIKHSFYYVPSSNRDLVIIGFEEEILKGEKIVKEFLLRQNILENNYSLCFLCPIYLNNMISNFKINNNNFLKEKNVVLRVYDPNYSRKHLNLYLEGKWKDIIDIKNMLFKYFDSNNHNKNQSKKNSIEDFQQYTYNQEMKLISKNIRKSFLEPNYIVKNWDLISPELCLDEEEIQAKDNCKSANLMKFLQNTDRDTVLNHLLYLSPGNYNSVFGLGKKDLVNDLIEYLEEAYDSYVNLKNVNKSCENKEDFMNRFNNNQFYLGKSNIWNNEISFQHLSNNDHPIRNFKELSPEHKILSQNENKLTNIKENDINLLQQYRIHSNNIEENEPISLKLIKNDYHLVENVIKIDFVKDEKFEPIKNVNNLERSLSQAFQSNGIIFNENQEITKQLSDRDFLQNKRKLVHNNNISPLSNNDDEKNKFYHNQYYNTPQNNQGYNYNYSNNDKVTQQIYIINNYNLSGGNTGLQHEKKPCINSLSGLEKKNQLKSDSESPSHMYSKMIEEKSENRNIFKTRPKFSTRFQHYYKSISSSKSDNYNNKYSKKSYKRNKLRNRKSASSSLSSSKSKSNISRSKSRDDLKLKEGLLKKSNEDYLDKNSSKSNKKRNKRIKKSRTQSKESMQSVFSANRPKNKFQNKIHNNLQRINQDNYQNKQRFGYNNFNFNNNNNIFNHHNRDNRIKNYYEKDFYQNKFKSSNKFKHQYFFERKNNNYMNHHNYSNRYNKPGFYFNKYYEKKDFNKDYRRSCVSEKSNSPSYVRKSPDCKSIKSIKKSRIGHYDSLNNLMIDEKESLLSEYIKLKKKLSRNSHSSSNNSESDVNILNCPISIRSSLKNPYKI